MDWTQKLLCIVNSVFISQSKCHLHNSSVVDLEPNSISTISRVAVNSFSLGPGLWLSGFSHLRVILDCLLEFCWIINSYSNSVE